MRVNQLVTGAVTLLALLPLSAGAQESGASPRGDWCRDWSERNDRARKCEVRRIPFTPVGTIRVDASPNGEVAVEGREGAAVEVWARIEAWAEEEDRAAALARQVQVEGGSGRVRAEGPRTGRREGWSVSYRVTTPRRADLDLESVNGGIRVDGVAGSIRFRSVNGGVTLADVAGEVRGSTTNGGLHISLGGRQWDGAGLDVRTTNGGITLEVPAQYAAHLETGTVNGGLSADFPITVQGRVDRRRLSLDLNGGGPAVRVFTTNGGVHLRRR